MTGVLLFGASGFIGRYVASALRAEPRIGTVTCPGRDRHDLVRDEPAGLVDLLRSAAPDAVVNCTGRLDGSGYQLIQAQALVTAKLIDAMAEAVPGARLVRLGSAAEYGPVPANRSVDEDHPARPVSEYGLSHLTGTRLALLASADGRIDGLVLRVFNPVGPGLPEQNLLGRAALLLREARDGGQRPVRFGPLGAYRDFVDVRDVASAVLAAVLVEQPAERVFNLASGTAVTAREAVRLLAGAVGYTGEIHEAEPPPARSGGVPWMCGDNRRAARTLGWVPGIPLAESVKAMAALDPTYP
jgi:nucleoside-diphosphate-sugar epimerase